MRSHNGPLYWRADSHAIAQRAAIRVGQPLFRKCSHAGYYRFLPAFFAGFAFAGAFLAGADFFAAGLGAGAAFLTGAGAFLTGALALAAAGAGLLAGLAGAGCGGFALGAAGAAFAGIPGADFAADPFAAA